MSATETPKLIEKEKFLEFINNNIGKPISLDGDMAYSFNQYNYRAQKITVEINNKFHSPEEIVNLFSELIDQKVDSSFRLFPPFNTDNGLNIHIGKNVFINSGCKFQDQGGIYIDDNVLIGHNVVLATLNHEEDPRHRQNLIPKPIHIKSGVWIGSNATILQGVTIGENAIIGAASVVTRDVSPNSVVAGVPAKFIRKIKVSEEKNES
ncbi:isoleucine patch [Piromyces finnis]|uniref:Isoleucine patch n=1 Tax=Piromyces finnis TaxID=1754191 RepID=A0A1Y1UWJ9_9FUNG|nr:isoleucine patch [Piromyces finnis]|eukprot:ORX41865.1 isoleucine patch [Piromyces finnis]